MFFSYICSAQCIYILFFILLICIFWHSHIKFVDLLSLRAFCVIQRIYYLTMVTTVSFRIILYILYSIWLCYRLHADTDILYLIRMRQPQQSSTLETQNTRSTTMMIIIMKNIGLFLSSPYFFLLFCFLIKIVYIYKKWMKCASRENVALKSAKLLAKNMKVEKKTVHQTYYKVKSEYNSKKFNKATKYMCCYMYMNWKLTNMCATHRDNIAERTSHQQSLRNIIKKGEMILNNRNEPSVTKFMMCIYTKHIFWFLYLSKTTTCSCRHS